MCIVHVLYLCNTYEVVRQNVFLFKWFYHPLLSIMYTVYTINSTECWLKSIVRLSADCAQSAIQCHCALNLLILSRQIYLAITRWALSGIGGVYVLTSLHLNFIRVFEPTCAYARWALMHCFLYVCMFGCDWTKSQTGPKVTDIGKYHVGESC